MTILEKSLRQKTPLHFKAVASTYLFGLAPSACTTSCDIGASSSTFISDCVMQFRTTEIPANKRRYSRKEHIGEETTVAIPQYSLRRPAPPRPFIFKRFETFFSTKQIFTFSEDFSMQSKL